MPSAKSRGCRTFGKPKSCSTVGGDAGAAGDVLADFSAAIAAWIRMEPRAIAAGSQPARLNQGREVIVCNEDVRASGSCKCIGGDRPCELYIANRGCPFVSYAPTHPDRSQLRLVAVYPATLLFMNRLFATAVPAAAHILAIGLLWTGLLTAQEASKNDAKSDQEKAGTMSNTDESGTPPSICPSM